MAGAVRPGWALPMAARTLSGDPLARSVASGPARTKLTRSVERNPPRRSNALARAASMRPGAAAGAASRTAAAAAAIARSAPGAARPTGKSPAHARAADCRRASGPRRSPPGRRARTAPAAPEASPQDPDAAEVVQDHHVDGPVGHHAR